MTLAGSAAVVGGTRAGPAQAASAAPAARAATAKVTVAATGTAVLSGKCIQLPVRIQPPTGVSHWTVETEVADALGSGFAFGDDDSPATSKLQHCPILDGVGKFHWKATMEWTDDSGESGGGQTFSGTFVIRKATRTGTLKISDTTPKYGQTVKFKVCIPGPRYVTYKLLVKASGQTATRTYDSGSTGCDTTKLKWPRTKKPVKYRLHIAGSDIAKAYDGKWVTVRGHA